MLCAVRLQVSLSTPERHMEEGGSRGIAPAIDGYRWSTPRCGRFTPEKEI